MGVIVVADELEATDDELETLAEAFATEELGTTEDELAIAELLDAFVKVLWKFVMGVTVAADELGATDDIELLDAFVEVLATDELEITEEAELLEAFDEVLWKFVIGVIVVADELGTTDDGLAEDKLELALTELIDELAEVVAADELAKTEDAELLEAFVDVLWKFVMGVILVADELGATDEIELELAMIELLDALTEAVAAEELDMAGDKVAIAELLDIFVEVLWKFVMGVTVAADELGAADDIELELAMDELLDAFTEAVAAVELDVEGDEVAIAELLETIVEVLWKFVMGVIVVADEPGTADEIELELAVTELLDALAEVLAVEELATAEDELAIPELLATFVEVLWKFVRGVIVVAAELDATGDELA
ncbi:hypothetical protein PLICRDRAFT_39311 [Plicaturopsis crispa FD-325 SS-3]|nr:hypothetical protein PLICRDRAFT_39311 [Plicaturopsis crispa FD-325 SS-3]